MNTNQDYQHFVLQSNWSNQTKRAYLSRFDSFLTFMDDQHGIDKDHFDELLGRYKEHLAGHLSLKGSTVNRYIGTAKHYISFLGVTPPAVPRLEEDNQTALNNTLSAEEETRILQFIETITAVRDRLLIKLMFLAALRPSECCSLRWIDLLDNDGHLLVTIGANKKTRNVPLAKTIADDLLLWFDQRKEKDLNGLVFTTREGSPISPGALDRIVKTHSHRSHINTNCMALRNTCIARWLEVEPNMLKVAKLAGLSPESLLKFKSNCSAATQSPSTTRRPASC